MLKVYPQCGDIDSSGFHELEFDSMVMESLGFMENDSSFDVAEMYCLVKMFNTVMRSSQFQEKQFYTDFVLIFKHKYKRAAFKALGCIIDDGIIAYSPQYDIHICPCLIFRQQDYYKVVRDE